MNNLIINYKKGTQPTCKHGHPFAGENLAFSATGARVCRACRKRLNDARLSRERVARLSPPRRRQARPEEAPRPTPLVVDGNTDAGWRRLHGIKERGHFDLSRITLLMTL